MRTSRKVVTGLAAVAVATAGALTAGSALGSGSGPGDDEDTPSFTSSVTAPAGADESEQDETEANEDAEQRALLDLAKVDATAARTAALATARGRVTETELENEDGNVVCDDCLDEVAIRELHGAESARVALDLVETGHAVICSLDVADTAAARAQFETATGRDLSWFQFVELPAETYLWLSA